MGVAAATSLFAVTAIANSAQAAPQASIVFGVDRDAGPLAVTPAQYVYLGHNYCWYDAGWQGAGFYWCGYAMRRGYGWGGGEGWRGWSRGQGGGGGRAVITGGHGGSHHTTYHAARVRPAVHSAHPVKGRTGDHR